MFGLLTGWSVSRYFWSNLLLEFFFRLHLILVCMTISFSRRFYFFVCGWVHTLQSYMPLHVCLCCQGVCFHIDYLYGCLAYCRFHWLLDKQSSCCKDSKRAHSLQGRTHVEPWWSVSRQLQVSMSIRKSGQVILQVTKQRWVNWTKITEKIAWWTGSRQLKSLQLLRP